MGIPCQADRFGALSFQCAPLFLATILNLVSVASLIAPVLFLDPFEMRQLVLVQRLTFIELFEYSPTLFGLDY